MKYYKNKIKIIGVISTNDNKQISSNTEFSLSFLKMEDDEQNIIYSPLSIKYALNMLNEGANGNTKTQIQNLIEKQSLTKYDNINEVLSLANCIYIRDTYVQYVKSDYKDTLAQKYNAEINYDEFKDAQNINKWIENQTLGIIKNMLTDNIVQDQDNEMLLINALAIDMSWQDEFDSSDTYGENFNLNDGSTMTATMMHNETSSDSISFYKDNTITSLSMDLKKYDDIQLEFIAIMPNNDLPKYIENFTIDKLNNITNKSKLASETKYGLDISIPRFSFDYDLELKNDLINLGITDAFDKEIADFSNMTNSTKKLYVSDALHKANINFTEKGIKAAASTVLIMKDTAMALNENKPEKIKIDKPFLYIIRDKDTKEIWFIGTVYEPNSWENDKAEYK